ECLPTETKLKGETNGHYLHSCCLRPRRRRVEEPAPLAGEAQGQSSPGDRNRDRGAQGPPRQIPGLIMLQWILSALSAPVFNSIVDAYKAKLAAANTQDKLAVDLAVKEIEAEIAARAQASAIIVAEQGRWWTSMIRPLAALPVVIYIWKVVVYDKVLGLGATDAITGDVGTWAGVIITTYFGGRTIEKVARIFRR